MNVDVLWVSWHDDILARGYADQGLLEEILAHETWTPPFPLTFTHREVRSDFPDVPGAMVILPARHHTSREDVDRLHSELSKLDWCLLFLSGDEEWAFPWAEFPETPTRRVWIMQPRPEHSHLSGLFPGGYYPGTREGISRIPRTHDWMFAGQVRDNLRRQQLVKYLHKMKGGLLHETNGYMQGWPRWKYLYELSTSKIIPSPSGPMTVDTARPLEAMEAGCVPVVDMLTPRGENYDYWSLIFGPNHPIPTTQHWGDFRNNFAQMKQQFPSLSNTVFSFWQQAKRRWAKQLQSDIWAIAGRPLFGTADDLISVIISTSPTPFHPSIDHITTVIDSVRAQLPRAEIIIVADGIRPEDEHFRPAYTEYLSNLLWACNYEWHNVVPIVCDEFLHQANATKKALSLVTTQCLLYLEHDTPIEGDIPWTDLIDNLMSGDANTIRLHFDVEIHPDHVPLHFGPVETLNGNTAPMQRIRVWWQRPHLSRVDWYRETLHAHFDQHSRTFIEDKLYSILHCDWLDQGEPVWDEWKIWTYMPEGNIKRSGHLDSRGDAAKHAVQF